MKKRILLVVFSLVLMFLLVGCSLDDLQETSQRNVVTNLYNSDVYDYVDPETGVHYLIYSHKSYNAGMGGIAPRLNPDGSIMVEKEGGKDGNSNDD